MTGAWGPRPVPYDVRGHAIMRDGLHALGDVCAGEFETTSHPEDYARTWAENMLSVERNKAAALGVLPT